MSGYPNCPRQDFKYCAICLVRPLPLHDRCTRPIPAA